ncbi:Na+/H+ antiporter subunit E [Nitrosomonas halophila]|uniref:Multicomponent K+:H+ antiporter subunit E n=1 Tax=Nitrosomonas halophila TaxID=44576 RepID=A0A1H3EH63_9PROT|nr:Na+/H+ antiporter subunit E [Nitrosomonas halophila]SDX78041.1 multicomponent K+:H+ antiporter subunit E [Nitrosomonas halophila]HRQ05962.1 Na+/H+ antiporter subunit E [Nitrosomonas halophila]
MRRLLPHPLLTPVLTLIWLLLVNSLEAGQIVLGLFLGWVLPVLTLQFWPEQVRIYKPMLLMRFLGIFLLDIVLANFTVARLILGRPERLQPVFVNVPLDVKSDLAISFLANVISLTPGTVSSRVSPDHRYLLVHALNETDTEALVATIKSRYEAPLKEIFEPC